MAPACSFPSCLSTFDLALSPGMMPASSILHLNGDGRITGFTRAAPTLFERTAESLDGEHVEDLWGNGLDGVVPGVVPGDAPSPEPPQEEHAAAAVESEAAPATTRDLLHAARETGHAVGTVRRGVAVPLHLDVTPAFDASGLAGYTVVVSRLFSGSPEEHRASAAGEPPSSGAFPTSPARPGLPDAAPSAIPSEKAADFHGSGDGQKGTQADRPAHDLLPRMRTRARRASSPSRTTSASIRRERETDLLEFAASIARRLPGSGDVDDLDDDVEAVLKSAVSFFGATGAELCIFGPTGTSTPEEHVWTCGSWGEAWDTLSDDARKTCQSLFSDGHPVLVVGSRVGVDAPQTAGHTVVASASLGDCVMAGVPLEAENAFAGTLKIGPMPPSVVTGSLGPVFDILASTLMGLSDRLHLQQRIHALEERHRRLFEDSSDVVFELDAKGVFRYVSPAAVQVTGYYPAELVGRRVDSLLYSEDRDAMPAFFDGENESRQEYRIRDRDGRERYLRVSLRAVAESDGSCVITGTATDVTARRRAEVALQAEKAFTEQALDRLPGLFCLVNHNLRIRRWNRRLREVLDVTASQVPACRLTELFDFRMRPQINDHIRRAFLGETTKFKGSVVTEEAARPHMFTAAPVEIEGERFVLAVGIDIGELVVTQRRLSESLEALRQMHSITIEDELSFDRKIQRLLQSGCEYLDADAAVLARIDEASYVVEHAAGPLAPRPGASASLGDTLCHRVLQSRPYEWPLRIEMNDPSAPSHAELNDPGVDEHTVVYTGIPIHVDGELSRTLSFSGSSDTCRSRAEDAAEYLKLLAQWIEAQHTQERTRTAMHRSEKRYRELFAAAPDAYAVIDSETEHLVDCNEAALQLLDRRRDQILGEHYSTLHPPHYLWKHGNTHARWLDRVTEHGHWLSNDVPVRSGRRSRDSTYVDISARHVDLGDTPYVLAVLRDVTQRKETGDALLQAAARNQEFNDELRTLVRVSTGLETNLDSNIVAQRIVAGTVDTIGPATRASLWRFHNGTATLLITDRPGEGTNVHDDVRVPMAEGLFSTVEEDIASAQVADVGAARALDAEIAHPAFFGVRSLVAVPIATNERILGALVAESTETTNAFQDRHVDLLRSLGAQAAVSLHNAHALEEVRALSQRLLQAQEDERQRLAQELHDETGGLLTALQFKLQEVQMCMAPSSLAALSAPPTDDPSPDAPPGDDGNPADAPLNPESVEEALSALDSARELTMNLSDLLRRVSRSLRPKILDDIGLSAALPWLVREYGEQSGLDISFSSTIDPEARYPALVETAAFRIIQEALTNAAKYADTDEVQVVVNTFDDRIRLHVIDEGTGFDADAWRQSTTSTLGLHGMIERAERLGGTVEIVSDPGEGTRISATLPTHLDENHD